MSLKLNKILLDFGENKAFFMENTTTNVKKN